MTLGDDLPDVKPFFPFGTSKPTEPPQRWSSAGGTKAPTGEKQSQSGSRSALAWLMDTNTSLKTSYEEACGEYAPSLRRRGRSVGEQLMETLMLPAQPPPGSMNLEDPDTADALDPLVSPLLDPFMEGLQQPFQDAYETARRQVIAGTIGTGLVGLLAGFLLGRYVGRGDGKKG